MDWKKVEQKIEKFLDKHPDKTEKVLKFLDKYGPKLVVLVSVVTIGFCVNGILAQNAEFQRQAIEKQISQLGSFTIKIVDEKGEAKLLYKDKTVEVREGVLYVCPLKTLNCANNSKAIMLHGNFIVEQQN